MRTCAILTLALAALVLAPSALAADQPGPVSETATLRDVTSTISYTVGSAEDSGFTGITGLHLTIVRAGVTAFDGPLNVTNCGEPSCTPWPLNGTKTKQRVSVLNVDADAEPEVLVETFSGGAHCCSQLTIFDYRSGAYHKRTHQFYDPGFTVTNLDKRGAVELASNDWRFNYKYTSYAASYAPVQVFRVNGDRLVDVTRRFPALLRKDAAAAYKLGRTYCGVDDAETMGVWAAYGADQYRLGKRAAAMRTLRAQVAAGCVSGSGSPATFVKRLDAFLVGLGYAAR